jgi:membrane dipeptidase
MPTRRFALVKQVDRVPSMVVPLDREQEARFQRLLEEIVMIDLHEHTMVLPEDLTYFDEYLRRGDYEWGYDAVRHGGWTAVCTANGFRGMAFTPDLSQSAFTHLVEELALMVNDIDRHRDTVMKVLNADDILRAKADGKIGFMPTVEHLALGPSLHQVDVLYALGVRLAGITYARKTYVGDGLNERTDCGLSEFGIEVVHRMNDLGMAVDVSHAGRQTAKDAIEHSRAPIVFSHNASYTLRPNRRTRTDDELLACAQKGGLIAITAVPNSLSDDPRQDITCVLDHYDYMVKLVGVDHVGIGTDTLIGDHVGFHGLMDRANPDAPRPSRPAPYLSGLESPADGTNIIRGLISRGHSDAAITKIAGANALAYFRRVLA